MSRQLETIVAVPRREVRRGDLSVSARWILASASVLSGGALLTYGGVHGWPALALLGVGGLMLWWVPVPTSVVGYSAMLAVQAWIWVGRIALADLFLGPAIARMAFSMRNHRSLVRSSSLRWPFLLLLGALTLGTILGAARSGGLVPYVLVNKDVGIVYLILGFFTITETLHDQCSVERLTRWFVVGVGLANAVSLLGMALALLGLPNELYFTGNMRLYGSMLNPNRFGSILLMAAMIELGAWEALAVVPRWRRANLGMLGLSLALTLSRGSWLAVAAGAAALLALQLAASVGRPMAHSLRVTALWLLVPTAALFALSRMSSPRFDLTHSTEHADRLRQSLVEACQANPALPICSSVQMPQSEPLGAAGTRPGRPNTPLPELLPYPVGVPPDRENAKRSLTNSRGVEDRLAILAVAARAYTSNWRTILLGIGVDTFFATSAAAFGVPLVIHNTFAWFLFEMGPLGLAAVSWIWVTTMRSLWIAYRAQDWRSALAPGLIASLVGMTVFCLLNEGFYQRHLWLLFALADRLGRTSPAVTR